MTAYLLIFMLFSIYMNQHGPHLNFLDVSLITTAVFFLVLLLIICFSSGNDE